jgi:hypothetical protein
MTITNTNTSGNAAIDNIAVSDDNVVTALNNDNSGAAELSGSEDTAYAKIIETKDAIISTYEKQVESLNAQIATLIRNGASITEEPKTQEAEQATQGTPVHNFMGGFGHGIDAYADTGFDVKSLGLEIGKHDK